MSEKGDALRLADIADQIDYISSAVAGKTLVDFVDDRTLGLARRD